MPSRRIGCWLRALLPSVNASRRIGRALSPANLIARPKRFAYSVVRRSRIGRWLRLARLNVLARRGAHQDFSAFLKRSSSEWSAALSAAGAGQRVIIATNIGGHFGISAIDRLLAVALTLRGANVTTVLCDRALPACQMCEIDLVPAAMAYAPRTPPQSLCSYCYAPAASHIRKLGLQLASLGEYLTADDRLKATRIAGHVPAHTVKSFIWRDVPVGEHALAGALRYFARGELAGEPTGEGILRRYLVATILTTIAYERLFEAVRPEVVVAHHGIYVPQGIVTTMARARGIRVVTWNPAYRRHCFIFSHDDTYHHTLLNEPVDRWGEVALTQEERERIEGYLKSRWHGAEDWIRFHREPDFWQAADLKELGLDPQKPLVVALTNVFWDAQLHYPANAFATQREWLVETIRWFEGRPDLQLVVRIHPAEESGSPASRQRAADEIGAAFPRMPDNVKIVHPESALSTYALAAHADAALIYATKMGVELTGVGIPVVVAGEAWVRGKGFTYDVVSREDYVHWLGKLPFGERLDASMHERAQRYAHYFFFRRMLPLDFVAPHPGARRFTVAIDDLAALREGRHIGLDVICKGILEGSPFVMPTAAPT